MWIRLKKGVIVVDFEKLVDEVLEELLKRLRSYTYDSHPRIVDRDVSHCYKLQEERSIYRHGDLQEKRLISCNRSVTQEVDLSSKRLLTEQMLEESSLSKYQMIIISKRCIVTPLAMDYIGDRGISIKRI